MGGEDVMGEARSTMKLGLEGVDGVGVGVEEFDRFSL